MMMIIIIIIVIESLTDSYLLLMAVSRVALTDFILTSPRNSEKMSSLPPAYSNYTDGPQPV